MQDRFGSVRGEYRSFFFVISGTAVDVMIFDVEQVYTSSVILAHIIVFAGITVCAEQMI